MMRTLLLFVFALGITGSTIAQKAVLTGPKSPDDVFVRVYKKDTTTALKDWLYNTYHHPNTELEKYQVWSKEKIIEYISCNCNINRMTSVTHNAYKIKKQKLEILLINRERKRKIKKINGL